MLNLPLRSSLTSWLANSQNPEPIQGSSNVEKPSTDKDADPPSANYRRYRSGRGYSHSLLPVHEYHHHLNSQDPDPIPGSSNIEKPSADRDAYPPSGMVAATQRRHRSGRGYSRPLHEHHHHHLKPISWKKLTTLFHPHLVISESSPTYRILPIFSGIVVPFSILLDIPSLSGHWYVRTGPNSETIETRPNPRLLNIAMAVSMACALFACICLVIRFTERAVKAMTILAIISLTVHG